MSGQEDVREFRGLVQEQVLNDDAFHRRQGGSHVLGVGIGLSDVLPLDVQTLEVPVERRLEHVRDAQSGLVLQADAPGALEQMPDGVVRDVAVAGELVREGAHVAGALHIVLAPQRIDAHTLAPTLPVAIARFAIPMTMVDPWLCSVTPRP